MHKINLRELYPDMYKTDTFLEVTDEVQAVFLSDKRAEAAHERQMYRYKAQYSLDCDNGIEDAVVHRSPTPEEALEDKQLRDQIYTAVMEAILDGIDQSSINQALANEYASHIAANEQQVEQALEFKARLYESLITGTISKEEYTDYKARYTRIAENAKESIRVLKEKLADVLENRSERNRWISHFTQFSTMETLDRKAVVHMIQSIKVIGKKELEITFTYQDEYQKAIQLIQLAEQTSQRKVG